MFDWITGAIDSMGLFGVALFMFLENVFPPIPSELIMPLAGFNAARGDMNLITVIIAGSIGSLAGAQLWYEIGRRIGRQRIRALADRHGRWLTVSPDEFDQADHWFERHGGMAVLIGRLIPTVRTFISVPAGIARMGRVHFLLLSGIGTVAWTSLLAVLGYVLEGGYDAVSAWLDPVSTAVVVALIGAYLYRVATYGRRQRRKHPLDA
ncbi:alkaline phosphatase [Pacificitalea manganoxidans]|uniref:Alkaline phosphatase n=1 Tax=Pacificitalea manganoxidans TaxID=1411902 RepID=A0A291M2H1_9RHOB|nr:DedA family protein [Pacificitalea manganoxidans]ATI43166.1 alkaline phosphatase [Pacificitalea manganoxidans]MDR6306893.1 membrane protein DedA with SNARE-associated domain [Pacificitalea manganoxidans]